MIHLFSHNLGGDVAVNTHESVTDHSPGAVTVVAYTNGF